MKEYQVRIDYPSDVLVLRANSKEEAEEKAIEMSGEVTIHAQKECTANAEEIEKDWSLGHSKD